MYMYIYSCYVWARARAIKLAIDFELGDFKFGAQCFLLSVDASVCLAI